MRNGEGGVRAAGSRGGRIALVAICIAGTLLIFRPAWSQNTPSLTSGFTSDHPVTIFGDPTYDVPAGQIQTVPNVIADGATPGSVIKTDTGTLVLTGVNTYTGATTITGGTLSLVAPGSITTSSGVGLTAAGTIFDISGVTSFTTIQGLAGVTGSTVNLGNNTLAINQTGISTLAGVLTGGNASTLFLQGTGTEILSGVNTTFTGGVFIDQGTLSLGPGGAISSAGNIFVNGGAAGFDISNAGNQTVQNLTAIGGGTVTLGGNTLTTINTGTSSFSGVISGTGGLIVQGPGTLQISGVNIYTGPTVLDNGTLALGLTGSIAASSGLNLAAAGTTFDISESTNQTIKDLSGVAGSLVNLGPFTLTAGTANSTIFAGVISGLTPVNGLTKQGTGTLTLAGVSTYIGPTTINGGTLALVGTGSIAMSSGVALTAAGTRFDISGVASPATIQGLTGVTGSTVNLGNNNLALNQTGTSTFAGALTGTGTLTLLGSADLELTGNSGNFAGATLVTGQVLDVGPAATPGAVLGGNVTVQNGGLVVGHGTILGSLTNSSGTVMPGGSIGTLTVGGNYVQGSSGTLLVELSPNAASQLAVAGSASLAGTLALASAPGQGYVPFSRFAVLTAGNGVSGTFSQVTGTFPVLPVTVQYLPNAVDLVLGGFVGAKGNQTAVASALNAAFPTATGDFATVLDTAVNLSPAQMQRSLSSFGGQIYGNLAQVSLQDRRLFLGAMDDRIRIPGGDSPSAAVLGRLGGGLPGMWGGGANGPQFAALANAINDPLTDAVNASIASMTAAPASSGNLWARGFGQFGSLDSSGGALGSNYSTGGGAIGADLIVTPQSLFGIAASGGQSSVSLTTNPENGTVSFVQIGAYGVQALSGGVAVDGAAIYSHDHYSVSRGVELPETSRVATSNHGGNDAVVDVGLSRPSLFAGWQVTPRVGLSYFHIDQAAFSESGAGSLDLAVSPNALNALFSRIGVAMAQPIRLGEVTLVPEFRAAWLHNFFDNQARLSASFIGTGASFGEVGPHVGDNAADLGAGLSLAIAQTVIPGQVSGFIQYDATLASHETASTVAGGLRFKW